MSTYRVISSQSQATLKQTQEPSYAVRPTGFIQELTIDKSPGTVIWGSACQQRNRNYRETCNRPNESAFSDPRKDISSKCVNQECNHIVEDVQQELMPRLRLIVLAPVSSDLM